MTETLEKFKIAFAEATKEAHEIALRHGFHDKPAEDGTVLCLIHSEISEALEALRHGNPPDKHCPEYSGVEVELADAVIRIMDYAGLRGWDIAGAIIAKMRHNEGREYKHGKKF